jgi:hypothetical protein
MKNEFPELIKLGDDLERAIAADIAAVRTPRRVPLRRRRFLLAAAVLMIVVPGVAFAAIALTGEQVAASLPAGTRMLIGTDPHCTAVREGVEYHCVLSRPPASPEVSDLKGTVEPTVDETKHVNGGCRSLSSDGVTWQCYIGQEAVRQKIISRGFLGEYAPQPGVG